MRTKNAEEGRLYPIRYRTLLDIYKRGHQPMAYFCSAELHTFWSVTKEREKDLSTLRESMVDYYFAEVYQSGTGGMIRKILIDNLIRRFCNWLPTVSRTTCKIAPPTKLSREREEFAIMISLNEKGAHRHIDYPVINTLLAYYGEHSPRMPTAEDLDGIIRFIKTTKCDKIYSTWGLAEAIAKATGLMEEFQEYKRTRLYTREEFVRKESWQKALDLSLEIAKIRRRKAAEEIKNKDKGFRELSEQCKLVREMKRKYNY